MAGGHNRTEVLCGGLVRVSDDQHTVLWILLWITMNIFQTLLNKLVFTHTPFNYPCILTTVNMIFNYAFCTIYVAKGWVEHKPITSRSDMNRLQVFSLLLAGHVVLNIAGLQFVTVSLSSIMRSTIPIITMFLSIVVLRKSYPIPQMIAVFPIVIGVMMCVKGDLDFHLIGFTIVICGCLVAALKGVVASVLLTGSLKMHPIELMYYVAPYTILELVISAVVVGEVSRLYEEAHILTQPKVIAMIIVTSTLSFFVNISNFSVNKRTSPLTLAVCGNFKRVLTIVLSIFIFQKRISALNIAGLIIGSIGTFIYSGLEYRYRQRRKEIIMLEDAKDMETPPLNGHRSNARSLAFMHSGPSVGPVEGMPGAIRVIIDTDNNILETETHKRAMFSPKDQHRHSWKHVAAEPS